MNDLDRNNFQIQGWTEPRVAQLKALWGTLSASQIARELGHGVSRNAVIGKSHRLGLTTPRKPVPPSKEVVMAKRKRQHAAWLTMGEVSPPMFKDLPPEDPLRCACHLLELRPGMCKWVINSDELLCCGDVIVPGYPYCDYHAHLSYRNWEG
jgi:GcrA cell cycle regulator